MKLILVGTDHRLQHSIFQDSLTRAWLPRNGGHRYRRLVVYCIKKLGVKAVLEETHPNQEKLAPTIASVTAKKSGVAWKSLGLGEPGLEDGLIDPPLIEAIQTRVKPEVLAGIYNLEIQKIREEFMFTMIMDALREHGSVLAIAGYVHLGVLARLFEVEDVPVTAYLFTFPLVVDEDKS